jgi:hypothetical protein
MKKLILLLAAALLISCGDKIIYDQQGNVGYMMQDPIFPQNYILYDSEKGKEAYIMRDPIFADEDNWIIFPEQK